jgi:hypothetical protein
MTRVVGKMALAFFKTYKLISINGVFTSIGGSQTANHGCNRKGGDGAMIIILP